MAPVAAAAAAGSRCRRRRFLPTRTQQRQLLLSLVLCAAASGVTATVAAGPPAAAAATSVRALGAAMYPSHGGSGGCYKLLHVRGESGCWSAASGSLLGPEDAPLAMWPLPSAKPPSAQPPSPPAAPALALPASPVVLVALAADSPALLARLARGHAELAAAGQQEGEAGSEDARLARLVRGVVVVDCAAADGGPPPPARYTALPPFPYGAEYAPPPSSSAPGNDEQQQASPPYAWNPDGLPELDPLRFRLPVPVIAVPGAAAAAAAAGAEGGAPAAAAALAFARDVLRRAASNDAAAAAPSGHARGRARHHATLSLGMTARGNASACLAAGACKPLGGFSVLAVVPPRAPPATPPAAAGGPPATRRRRALTTAEAEVEAAASAAAATAPSSAPAASEADAKIPPPPPPRPPPPLVLVAAQADGYDLFHDLVRGADAPLSGLVAMLAAAYALRESAIATAAAAAAAAGSSPAAPPSSSSSWPGVFTGRVAFLALAGEPWGYMGSRRFLYELESGGAAWAEAILGPNASLADVSAVIEVGQVGRAARVMGGVMMGAGGGGRRGSSNESGERRAFFLHTRGDGGGGAAGGGRGDLPLSLTRAFEGAAAGANATVAARPSEGEEEEGDEGGGGQGEGPSPGSPRPPGLPPSSLYSFARVLPAPSPPLALLAEFDDRMDGANPYFGGGRFDAGVQTEEEDDDDDEQQQQQQGLDVASVSSAAVLLASALQRLVLPPSAPAPNATAVRAIVESYARCLATDVPGLACPMAGAVMGPDAGPGAAPAAAPSIPPPPRYVGVLQALPAPQPYGREYASPARKDPLARFVWGALVASTMVEAGEGQQQPPEPASRCADAAAAERCVASGRVCAAPPATADSVFFGGPCVNATVRYVPSYSLRIACAEGCNGSSGGGGGGGDPASASAAVPFRWGEARGEAAAAADAWMRRYGWPEDPMWTESDWPYGVPSVRLYLADAPGAEAAALAAGVAATAAAAAAGWGLRRRLVRARVFGLLKK